MKINYFKDETIGENRIDIGIFKTKGRRTLMKVIDKKSFWSTVCGVFTCLSIGKIALEAVWQGTFGNYQANFLMMLFLAFMGTLVLSQHYRLQRFPISLVIILQYVVMIVLVMLIIWISGFFVPLSEHAYHDKFWSFTIPYVILAFVYYISLYLEVKKANRLLQNLKNKE